MAQSRDSASGPSPRGGLGTAEEEVRLLRGVVDATPGMLSYWGPDERNLFANQACARWFGRSPAELRGLHLHDLLGAEAYEDDRQHITGVLQGVPQQFERTVMGLMGTVRAHVVCTPDVVDGQVVGFVVAVSVATGVETELAAADQDGCPASRVLVVDADPLVRAGLGAIIGVAPDIDVVGEAATLEEALAAVGRARPDVVLMDVRLLPPDWAVAARPALAPGAPFPEVVVLTTSSFDEHLFDPMGAGAFGVLGKRSSPEELADRVRTAARREITRPVARREPLGEPWVTLVPRRLTRREREVLELAMRGLPNKEIAKRLFISVDTVKSHVKHLYAKLGTLDRRDLVAAGYEARMG
jgi:DNA-binding NarL/FixJ family response regulator